MLVILKCLKNYKEPDLIELALYLILNRPEMTDSFCHPRPDEVSGQGF